MPDRSDDIKQLFSHLGLNPGQYHELQDRTRAVTPPPSPIAATPAPAAPAAASPPPAVPPIVRAELAEDVSPSPPVVAPAPPQPAVAEPATSRLDRNRQASVSADAPISSTRRVDPGWPLIRAAQETPTRVAQVVSAPLTRREIPGSTRRLIEEMSRHRADRPSERLIEVAPIPRREPPAAAPSALSPGNASIKLGSQARQEPPVATVAQDERVSYLAPDSDLAQTFRRIGQPERLPQKRDARLHFSYSGGDDVSRTRKLKEENLEEVFERLSGQISKRSSGSPESQ